jgi:PPOX class probable F420-dependent enzyme
MPSTPSFADLAAERYLSITTFRRDGSQASTPVWVVSDGRDRLLVATSAKSWKARRIRLNAHVRVAACNARGRVHGPTLDGRARFVDEEALVRRLQREKYGWQVRLIETAYEATRRARRKPREPAVFIEIVPRRSDEVAIRAA